MKNVVKYGLPYFFRNRLQPRKIHGFNIGLPKTGTTSIAGMFRSNYRADHEPEHEWLISVLHDHCLHAIDDERLRSVLRRRDKRLWLEMESNCLLGYRPDLLYQSFPDAKYLLTVRDPASWLDSVFDNNLKYSAQEHSIIRKWHAFTFRPSAFPYGKHDAVLEDRGLYPLDAYLQCWADANRMALDSIAGEQLLIVQTKDISRSLDDMSRFLRIPADSISASRSHLYATREKHRVLEQIDQAYVRERIDDLCGPVLRSLSAASAVQLDRDR